MQIRVLKDTKAASCPLGISIKEYKAGESYEIFNELAEVFIVQGWGESEQKMLTPKLQNKAIESSPENKDFDGALSDFRAINNAFDKKDWSSEEIVVEKTNKKSKKSK
jgi:hypothetical protein